jgi:hypothetical protein
VDQVKTNRPIATLGVSQEGGTADMRGTKYGEPIVRGFGSKMGQAVFEGSYYQARNATALTGIALKIIEAYAAVSPCLVIYNGDSSSGQNPNARWIELDFIRLAWTVAPASATALHLYGFLEEGKRYTSGGTQLTIRNSNLLAPTDSGDLCYFGDLVVPAAGAERPVLGPLVARAQIPVVKDETVLDFGASGKSGTNGGVITSANRLVHPCAPVLIPPNSTFLLYPAMPGNAATAGQCEVEIGYVKR